MAGNSEAQVLAKALRSVIKKDPDVPKLLENLAGVLKLTISVLDSQEKRLYGENTLPEATYELTENGIVYGWLHSSKNGAEPIQQLLTLLVKKELEKKHIGVEILGLYREINMIYNLSEMISEKIDAGSIAHTALQEASQIIDTTHGLFLIYDEEQDKVLELAYFGNNPEQETYITRLNQLLKDLILRGTSSIVPKERIAANPALAHLKSVMYAPLKVKHRTLGMIVLGHDEEKEFTAAELKLLTTIALQSAGAIESAHLYQKGLKEARDKEEAIREMHEVSQKFVPNEFIKSLGKNNLTEVALGDLAERDVTVLFADIRGFTTLSESLEPRDNFLFINSFNKRMGPIVRKHHGFIMQYLGDGFMALFPKGAQHALRASVEMHKELEAYNAGRELKNRFPVKIGIGMQNGTLIMGITGDIDRLDAAIISDTVNTASRIEGLSKHFGSSILLTELCKNNLEDQGEFEFRYLGPVQVQGKQKPLGLYECINGDERSLFEHKMATLDDFNKAMKLYFNKEFAMAAVTFQKVLKKNRGDLPALLFLNRSAHLITQEIDDDWKGVESMTRK
jgi:class 3 adenylate cyclase